MSYTPPHLRNSQPFPDHLYLDEQDRIRRRKRAYAAAGAPSGGAVDKKRIAPNVYFFRRNDGTEGLGIWWTPPGERTVKCARLPGMPTVEQATREAQRRRSGVMPALPASATATPAVDAADIASQYLVNLRKRIRRDGPAGTNDTRKRTITQSTWMKKRSAFSTFGLLSDVEGRYPELIGTGRAMSARARARAHYDAMAPDEQKTHGPYDPGPLAGLTLEEIDGAAVIEAIEYLVDRALKPATIVCYLQQLRKFLRDCVRRDLIIVDAFAKLGDDEIPLLTRFRKRALTLEEQLRLVRELPEGQHRIGALLDIATGIRIGERLSLVWGDLDFERNRVTIDSSRSRSDPHGRLKSHAGVRSVPFAPEIAERLKAWRARTPAPGPEDPVWCTPRGNAFTTDALRKEVVAPAIERAGFNDGLDRRDAADASRRVTQHSLRHTYASTLLRNPRIDLATAAMLLGHADTSVTQNVYWHFVRDDRHERPVRDTVEAALRAAMGSDLRQLVGL
jgi:integrase